VSTHTPPVKQKRQHRDDPQPTTAMNVSALPSTATSSPYIPSSSHSSPMMHRPSVFPSSSSSANRTNRSDDHDGQRKPPNRRWSAPPLSWSPHSSPIVPSSLSSMATPVSIAHSHHSISSPLVDDVRQPIPPPPVAPTLPSSTLSSLLEPARVMASASIPLSTHWGAPSATGGGAGSNSRRKSIPITTSSMNTNESTNQRVARRRAERRAETQRIYLQPNGKSQIKIGRGATPTTGSIMNSLPLSSTRAWK
jgi:hypothetical protein